jgi:hypothetical protein
MMLLKRKRQKSLKSKKQQLSGLLKIQQIQLKLKIKHRIKMMKKLRLR